MSLAAVISLLVGLILITVVLQDAFEVVLLNRPVRRRVRFMLLFYRLAWSIWLPVGARVKPGLRREAVLGVFGPASMVLLFVLWAAGIITGFGLLQWAIQTLLGSPPAPFIEYFVASGGAFFTLSDAGDVLHRSIASRILVLIEAGTGFGFIALMVTYLPVLDQHFFQRDAKLVTMGAQAGSPPTSIGLLLWHARANENDLEHLNDWLRSWELWSAGLIESHSSYPMLAFYRSQHSNQSWLASLAVILDCCTLMLAGFDEQVLNQAECTYMAAFRVLIEINQALDLPEAPDSPTRAMTQETYRSICDAINGSGYAWNDGADTKKAIVALSRNYEPLLSRIGVYLMLALPDWISPLNPLPSTMNDREAALARLIGGEAQTAEEA